MNSSSPSQSFDSAVAALEARVSAAIPFPGLVVVHLWAPWCPDCVSEFHPGGWDSFVRDHPRARFIFVAVWSETDGNEELRKHGLEPGGNLTVLHHPNPSRKKEDRMASFLGRPIRWIPTTWIYQGGSHARSIDTGTVDFSELRRIGREAPLK